MRPDQHLRFVELLVGHASATCRRHRPGPCWRSRRGCGAGGRGCARCRGGTWRPPSSALASREPSGPSRGILHPRLGGVASRSRQASPSTARSWTSTTRPSPPTRPAMRDRLRAPRGVTSRPGRWSSLPSLVAAPELGARSRRAPCLRGPARKTSGSTGPLSPSVVGALAGPGASGVGAPDRPWRSSRRFS